MVETVVGTPDAVLIGWGKELDLALESLNSEGDHDAAIAILDKMEDLCNDIARTPATTLAGLCVKARATGEDLAFIGDPMKEKSVAGRLTTSLLRDLLSMGAAI
jgi:hypothetical protein